MILEKKILKVFIKSFNVPKFLIIFFLLIMTSCNPYVITKLSRIYPTLDYKEKVSLKNEQNYFAAALFLYLSLFQCTGFDCHS